MLIEITLSRHIFAIIYGLAATQTYEVHLNLIVIFLVAAWVSAGLLLLGNPPPPSPNTFSQIHPLPV